MLYVLMKSGGLGAAYPDPTSKIYDFHLNQGEGFAWVTRTVERDEDGEIVTVPTAAEIATGMGMCFEKRMHAYVDAIYSDKTKSSIAYHAMTAQEESRTDIYAACKTAASWMAGCVAYWRSKVAELESAQDPTSVTWDIETACPEPEGGLPRLSDIEAMWSA